MSVEDNNKDKDKTEPEEPRRILVPMSEQMSQDIADKFMNEAMKAGRENQQDIRMGGKVKRFNYHAINQGEKQKLVQIEVRRGLAITNLIDFTQRKKKKEEVELFSEVDYEYRETMANMFLVDPETGNGMSKEDFALTEPEQMNLIFEGYMMRTEKPIPLPLETARRT